MLKIDICYAGEQRPTSHTFLLSQVDINMKIKKKTIDSSKGTQVHTIPAQRFYIAAYHKKKRNKLKKQEFNLI